MHKFRRLLVSFDSRLNQHLPCPLPLELLLESQCFYIETVHPVCSLSLRIIIFKHKYIATVSSPVLLACIINEQYSPRCLTLLCGVTTEQ